MTATGLRRLVPLAACIAATTLVSGCGTVGYLAQSVGGGLSVLAAREDIDGLVADPQTPEALRQRLELATTMRAFAAAELALPDDGSYRSYVDVGRSFVVMNVVATAELSVDPVTWCFPVVGCVPYRGYFNEADAVAFGETLAADGLDVALSPSTAYSTLGWFDDPLLSTLLIRSDETLAGTIFHELSHQRVYVQDDGTFNESYAVAVEREGVRRWLARYGAPGAVAAYELENRREAGFLALVQGARADLDALFRSGVSDEEKRAGKAAIFAELQADYRGLRASWGGYDGYDGWFQRDLNNAHLALVGTYTDYLTAFEALLDSVGGDMAAFHAAVAELAALPRAERDTALRALAAG